MSAQRYRVEEFDNGFTYRFFSEGPRGRIQKLVRYAEIEPGLFNLTFGDYHSGSDMLDDLARSDNGDREKILASVAYTVFDFFDIHPDSAIFFKGSTGSRTRLYQMAIAHRWREIGLGFDVKGFFGGNWITFERGRNYSAFLIRRK